MDQIFHFFLLKFIKKLESLRNYNTLNQQIYCFYLKNILFLLVQYFCDVTYNRSTFFI